MQGFPQSGIPHDDRIDHPIRVKGKLLLSQDSHSLWPGHRTLFGIDFTRQDLHQRGLAGAVRPGDRVTTAGDESGIDVFEQNEGAEAH